MKNCVNFRENWFLKKKETLCWSIFLFDLTWPIRHFMWKILDFTALVIWHNVVAAFSPGIAQINFEVHFFTRGQLCDTNPGQYFEIHFTINSFCWFCIWIIFNIPFSHESFLLFAFAAQFTYSSIGSKHRENFHVWLYENL